MNPIQYTVRLQRIVALMVGVSFLGLSAVLTFTNPYDPNSGVFAFWLFLAVVFVFLACTTLLLAFWWVFAVQKQILMVSQVNQLVYQSLVSSAFLLTAFILNHTQNLNIVNFLVLLAVFAMYYWWSKT